jgi:hypothetical protein
VSAIADSEGRWRAECGWRSGPLSRHPRRADVFPCSYPNPTVSVRFLLRYFETNRLTPFAIYCFVVGVALSIGFALT